MKLTLTLLALLCAPLIGHALTLEWNANSETNLAGYRVYVGRASREYSTNTFTTTNTFLTLSNLVSGTNVFAVTAFDTDGLESDFSDEVSTIVTNRPVKVKGVRFRAQMNVQSAPTVTGPWIPVVQIAQLDTTPGSQFYRLQLASILQNNLTPPPVLPLTSGSRVGKLLPAPKLSRQLPPFPAPP